MALTWLREFLNLKNKIQTQTQTYPDKPALEHASPNQSPPKTSNRYQNITVSTRNDWRTDVVR